MTYLAANHITFAYNDNPVVRDLSLSVTGGELLGLIGPNGAGKSSLLCALAGLGKLKTGKATVDGHDISRMTFAERARSIGLVPQGEIQTWPLTVEEIVLLGRAAHRGWLLPYSEMDHAIVDKVLSDTGLLALRDRSVDKLSGGERQRVLIARALAQEARILLFDEPTANLDFHYQMQILDLVRKLAFDNKLAVVVAIHDLTLAARYCDRLIILNNGEAIASGTPPEVFTSKNLETIFRVEGELYRDPHGEWAISAKCKYDFYN